MQRTENVPVPMAGIAQIPDEADHWFKRWDGELPAGLQQECDAAIAEAMAEHRRRREAVKLGMQLSTYWPADRGNLDEEDG